MSDSPLVFHLTAADLKQYEVSVDRDTDWSVLTETGDADPWRWTWQIRPRTGLGVTSGHAIHRTHKHLHDTRGEAWAEMMGALLVVLAGEDDPVAHPDGPGRAKEEGGILSKHLTPAGVTDEQRIAERRDWYGRIAFRVSMRCISVPEIGWEDVGQLTRDRYGAIAEAVIDAFVTGEIAPEVALDAATTPQVGDEASDAINESASVLGALSDAERDANELASYRDAAKAAYDNPWAAPPAPQPAPANQRGK